MSELVLRSNNITDEGTRALAALLSSTDSGLRFIDLRENRISKQGIKALADALERSNRVRHVYIHASGKIEAMGTDIQKLSGGGEGGGGKHETASATKSNVPMVKVETVCIVDIRSNNEPQGQSRTAGSTVKGRSSSEAAAVYAPMLATSRMTVLVPSTKGVRNKVKKATKGPKSLQQHFTGGKSYKRSLVNISRGQGQGQLPMLPLSPKDNVAAISPDKKSGAANSQINKGQQALTSGFKQDVRVQ